MNGIPYLKSDDCACSSVGAISQSSGVKRFFRCMSSNCIVHNVASSGTFWLTSSSQLAVKFENLAPTHVELTLSWQIVVKFEFFKRVSFLLLDPKLREQWDKIS